MTKPSRILAATDLSAPAGQAADRAARLAQETGAALTLCHAVPQGPLQELREWLGGPAADALVARADADLSAQAQAIKARRQVAVRTRVASGPVVDTLLAAVADEAADLLVLGARGAGFMRPLFLGSTAERLLPRATLPLLVVRQQPHETYRRVLLALDFSPATPALIALARAVAPKARLILFHAWQVPFEDKLRFAGVEPATIEHYRVQARQRATLRLEAAAAQAGLEAGHWDPCLFEGEAALRLVEQEQVRGADLVVVGKQPQSAVEALLLGSTTRHLLAEGRADVLIGAGA